MKGFTERNPKVIGAVVVGVVAVLVAGALFFNRSLFSSTYPVDARFANAAGIKPGTEVFLAGVDVGSVGSVRQVGSSVIARLDVNSGVVLPRHTSAAIQVQTLLGVVGVDLQPHAGWGHPLRPGALITDTTVPVEYYNLQNTAGHLLERSNAAAFNQLIGSLAKVTAGKQAQVAEIIKGLNALTSVVDQRQGQVSQLIDSANVLSSTLQSRDSQLVSLIDNLQTVLQGLAAHQSALAALIDNTDTVATNTANLVAANRPQLDALISSLETDLGIVSSHQVDLAQAVAYLGAAFKGYASITYSGASNTPNGPWVNIYTDLVGATAGGVLGSCGTFSQVMRLVLGPDPLPCSARTGPLPPAGSSASGAGSSASGSGSASGSASGGASGGAALPAGTPSILGGIAGSSGGSSSGGSTGGGNPLSSLFSPILGGGS